MEEGEEDEAVGESVARGVWSHEGRGGAGLVVRHQRHQRCAGGRASRHLVWLRLNFSLYGWNIVIHCWMKPTRWMDIGNLREATIIGWNWGC